jgi:hypothetical protein
VGLGRIFVILAGKTTRFGGAKPQMMQRPKQNGNINNSTKNRPILMKLMSKDWES